MNFLNRLVPFELGYIYRTELEKTEISVKRETSIKMLKTTNYQIKYKKFWSNIIIFVDYRIEDVGLWRENISYFNKKSEIFSSFYDEIYDTSKTRCIWRTDEISIKSSVKIDTFRSCIVFYFKDSVKIKFKKIDAEFAYMILYWKCIGTCSNCKNLTLSYSSEREPLSLDLINDLKKISMIEEEWITIEIETDLEEHSEMYYIKVLVEDNSSFFEETLCEVIR